MLNRPVSVRAPRRTQLCLFHTTHQTYPGVAVIRTTKVAVDQDSNHTQESSVRAIHESEMPKLLCVATKGGACADVNWNSLVKVQTIDADRYSGRQLSSVPGRRLQFSFDDAVMFCVAMYGYSLSRCYWDVQSWFVQYHGYLDGAQSRVWLAGAHYIH